MTNAGKAQRVREKLLALARRLEVLELMRGYTQQSGSPTPRL
jgi:hypothetical protein